MTFEQWMREVDSILIRYTNMSSDQMVDFASRSCYDSGESPAEGAISCLCEQDFDLEEIMEEIEQDYNL